MIAGFRWKAIILFSCDETLEVRVIISFLVMQVWLYTYLFVAWSVCINVYVCIVHIFVYAYICTYTRTHAFIKYVCSQLYSAYYWPKWCFHFIRTINSTAGESCSNCLENSPLEGCDLIHAYERRLTSFASATCSVSILPKQNSREAAGAFSPAWLHRPWHWIHEAMWNFAFTECGE